MENELPKRKHPRLKKFDYSSSGAYYMTICTQNRKCLLSRIKKSNEVLVGRGLAPAVTEGIEYTKYGKIAEEQLLLLEERYPFLKINRYVIMPNHIHAVPILGNRTAGARGVPRSECNEIWGFRASPRPTVVDIICAYKSLMTRECRKNGLVGSLFQTSFFEHVIRNQKEFDQIINYINENPAKWYFDELYSE